MRVRLIQENSVAFLMIHVNREGIEDNSFDSRYGGVKPDEDTVTSLELRLLGNTVFYINNFTNILR